jgi:hypothetical protein
VPLRLTQFYSYVGRCAISLSSGSLQCWLGVRHALMHAHVLA